MGGGDEDFLCSQQYGSQQASSQRSAGDVDQEQYYEYFANAFFKGLGELVTSQDAKLDVLATTSSAGWLGDSITKPWLKDAMSLLGGWSAGELRVGKEQQQVTEAGHQVIKDLVVTVLELADGVLAKEKAVAKTRHHRKLCNKFLQGVVLQRVSATLVAELSDTVNMSAIYSASTPRTSSVSSSPTPQELHAWFLRTHRWGNLLDWWNRPAPSSSDEDVINKDALKSRIIAWLGNSSPQQEEEEAGREGRLLSELVNKMFSSQNAKAYHFASQVQRLPILLMVKTNHVSNLLAYAGMYVRTSPSY